MKELNPNTALLNFVEAVIPLTAATFLFYLVFHRRLSVSGYRTVAFVADQSYYVE
jgi:hypothetical protein